MIWTGCYDSALSAIAQGQISIAANRTATPLWDVVDTNGDDQIVELERRSAVDRLRSLDRNNDETLTSEEWPRTFEIMISQGNAATTKLRSTPAPRSVPAASVGVAEVSQPVAPDWFKAMDANGDETISSGEFLGSEEQFQQYDDDNNDLLTPAEVAD